VLSALTHAMRSERRRAVSDDPRAVIVDISMVRAGGGASSSAWVLVDARVRMLAWRSRLYAGIDVVIPEDAVRVRFMFRRPTLPAR
jgi:hypothetical protein